METAQVLCTELDYVAGTKNTIQNTVSTQKIFSRSNGKLPIIPQYTDEFVKQSNEITENIVSLMRINNQLTVNAINAVKTKLQNP